MAAITYPIIWLMETLRQWRIRERQKAVEELTYETTTPDDHHQLDTLILVFPASLLIQCLPAGSIQDWSGAASRPWHRSRLRYSGRHRSRLRGTVPAGRSHPQIG